MWIAVLFVDMKQREGIERWKQTEREEEATRERERGRRENPPIPRSFENERPVSMGPQTLIYRARRRDLSLCQ